MMLVDANLLLFGANADAPEHDLAAAWLEQQLNGSTRVGLPWESLTAFVRLATNPRVVGRPLSGDEAWRFVEDWLAAPVAWVPQPTDRHAEILGGLIRKHRLSAKLVPDAHLAALAIAHGLTIASADSDFARFTDVRWLNPLSA